tara:strand:- start:901 stop:1815 length:915 start_codon:yes stop_codon:yes gene_type:complete
MQRVVVTGGAGFIGSHLVDRLVNDDFKVIVIDDESAESNDIFYHNPKAEYHKISIEDYNAIEPLFDNVKYVFHLAAVARIQLTMNQPEKAVSVNYNGTHNVLRASKKHNVKRVMYSSTSSAYGLKNPIPLKETMPNDCLNPYSVTKTGGEELCKLYNNVYGLETVTFRYFNVYGDRQPTKGQYAPVIGLFARQILEGNKMTVVGDGLQTRDYTNVLDVVEANILAAQCENEVTGEIFNIGCGKRYSVIDIVNMLKPGYLTYIAARLGEARDTLSDISKANKLLNWYPKVELIDWMKSYKKELGI